MKKIISLLMLAAFSLSSCSTLTDLASGGIDNAADSFGVSGRASGVIKKAVMPKEKEWGNGGAAQWQIITNEKTFDESGIVFENFGKIK